MSSLDGALARLVRTPVLLVAVDFDGTLAPIVENPDLAEPAPRALRALSTLARQPHSHVAVISGRALADLEARLQPVPDRVLLVGSHGSEFEPEMVGRLTEEQRADMAAIRAAVDAAADGQDGLYTEHKDASSTLHYRRASREAGARAVWRLLASRRAFGDRVHLRRGKKVVELSVLDAHKGQALDRLRVELGATAVLFVGDDRTDEDGFRSLRREDIGVKVGAGATSAAARLAGPLEVADLLARVAEMRHRALRDSVLAPITDLGFLSDQRTGALVTPDGEVCWLCPERFDRPALFASLLGGPTAGRFVIHPAGETARGHQRYRGDSMVLETRWPELTVVDYLDAAGAGEAGTLLVREIVPHGPGVTCDIEFAPAPDFARTETRLLPGDDRLEVRAGREAIELECPGVAFEIERLGRSDVARATVRLDGPLRLVLRVGRGTGAPRSADAVAAEWAAGLAGLKLPERWTEEVKRSALVLRGLVYRPSGAIVAALTTSLPEALGGDRNWDYRYCWLRDAALASGALVRLGSYREAEGYLRWLSDLVADGSPEDLRPLYGVEGETNLVEAELVHLLGYGASPPVRVGNSAVDQLQVDVFGTIVDLVHTYVRSGGPLEERLWQLVCRMVWAVSKRWHEPDAGIWEHRHLSRHHVHSKVMCWVALDRALALAHGSGRKAEPGWENLRDTIAEDILTHGWSASAGAFTVAYGCDDLDAAVLHLILSGLLSPQDPRAVATVEAIQRELGTGSTVYRYRFDDGFRGQEGGFHICASWLVDALVLLGRRHEAEALFRQIVGAKGATGLLSEEVDPATGAALGNVPQAYSHTGVIGNALAMAGMDKDGE